MFTYPNFSICATTACTYSTQGEKLHKRPQYFSTLVAGSTASSGLGRSKNTASTSKDSYESSSNP